jgi:hypothetical protein
MMRKLIRIIISITFLFILGGIPEHQPIAIANILLDGGNQYLPQMFNYSVSQTNTPTVNIPYFQVASVTESKFDEMSIFWFGKVKSDTNYTDVRIGYNDEALWIYTASFDRRLWYNSSSTGNNLEAWDAVTLLLHVDGASIPFVPLSQSYQFVAQLHTWEANTNFEKAYQGNGAQWVTKGGLLFSTVSGWRGNYPNDNVDDSGWAMTFKIPFTSLGLSGKPSAGTTWRLGFMLHDRDSQAGPALTDQVWPELINLQSPASWGILRFGMPTFTPPDVTNQQTTTIRNRLNGVVVPDVAAGGGATCGANLNIWTQWGEANYAARGDFNIQNQVDIADFPCFSKYFVTFPLTSIPAGKTIRSAKLILHEFGGADPNNAYSSLIQVLRIGQDWSESSLNWNNSPLAIENVAQTWVGVYKKQLVWPGDPYEWDISRAVTQAYQEGSPLRLVLYSADGKYHSGKYFVSSDTGDWNEDGRPTLVVEWGTKP